MTSILDPDRHRFDRSTYERPNYKFRCGRAATWGKPCMRGPNLDGSCGGTTACSPVKNKNDRFECRRSAIAGGPCEHGPNSDGSCSVTQPPCSPRRSLRGIRGRLSVLALGLVLAFIGGSMGPSDSNIVGFNWTIPGPLTDTHANFITDSDCNMCHVNHNSGGVNWIKAVFTPGDVTANCTNCHSFEGSARLAHNRETPGRTDVPETTCLMCHTEHKGADANIVTLNDFQCASCHEKKFTNFSEAHPKFPDRFPYDRRTAIKFNHASHFGKYFTDSRYTEKAPTTCLACHSTNPDKRSLERDAFENNCAACHGGQMASRELVVLRLPEFTEDTIDRDSVIEACGQMSDELEALLLPAFIRQARLEKEHQAASGGGGSNSSTVEALLAGLLDSSRFADWLPAPPPVGASVTLAALADDALIANLAAGLADAVDVLAAHEDKIGSGLDVNMRDENGNDREVFRAGDFMVINIPEVGHDRYLMIDYFMSDGQVLHMFPNSSVEDNFVPAGKSVTLGVPEVGKQAWQIGPPFGDDLLVVGATDKRLFGERPMVESSEGYLILLEELVTEAEGDGTVDIQYRVVSTAKDDAAARVIVAQRRQNEDLLSEAAARTAEAARLAEEAARLAEEALLAEQATQLAMLEAEEAEEAAEEEEEDEEEEYESVSSEENSIIGAYLLNVAIDDPDKYTVPVQELILAMAEGGVDPLAELIDERAGDSISAKLLAGLNPEIIKRLACAWAANLEYELPAEAAMGGWYGDYLELRYRPAGHGDAVSKNWIEFSLAAAQDAEDDDSGERAIALRDDLIDPKQGVGACAKCHSVNVSMDEENILSIGWRARDVTDTGKNFKFSHGAHLNVLGARSTAVDQTEQGCRVCHVLNMEADFAGGYDDFDTQTYASNFKAIDKDTCTDCHSTNNVQQGCQLCHDYHRGAAFQIKVSVFQDEDF